MDILAKVKNWFRALRSSFSQTLSTSELKTVAGIDYRKATSRDINKLLEVEQNVFEEIPWTYSHFDYEIANQRRVLFILAEKNENILGYIGLRWSWELDELHISNFVVKKEAQNQGIGSQLLRDAEEIAQDLEVAKLSLEVRRDNLGAQTFYKKRNFEVRESLKDYYSDGADALLMIKVLSPAN